MKNVHYFLLLLVGAAVSMGMTACEKVGDSTEEDIPTPEQIVVEEGSKKVEFPIQQDAWTTWNLINLENGEMKQVEDDKSKDFAMPAEGWDIAFHRFDAATNGGQVMKLDATQLNEVKGVPDGNYLEDNRNVQPVYLGMPPMGKNKAQRMLNPALCTWVSKGSGMPPTYTLNKEVFVVKVRGHVYAIKLDFQDVEGKGRMGTVLYKDLLAAKAK